MLFSTTLFHTPSTILIDLPKVILLVFSNHPKNHLTIIIEKIIFKKVHFGRRNYFWKCVIYFHLLLFNFTTTGWTKNSDPDLFRMDQYFVPPCNITQCVQSNKNFIPSFLHVSVCLEKFSRLGILKSTVLSYYNFVYCCSLFLHHSNGLGFVSLRRRFLGDVHDRWPEKILRSHEENGQQKASQSYSKAESKLDKEYFWPDPKVPNKRTFMISYNLGYV